MLHLKMIFRSWWRNGLSTIISLTSLTIGLVCSTMLILFVLGEYKIANALGDTEDIYLLEGRNPFFKEDNIRTSYLRPNVGFDIAEQFGDVKEHLFFDALSIEYDTKKRPRKALYRVTSNLCDLFEIPVKEGDLRKTLSSASEIAVTESFMQEVYGKSAVLGDVVSGVSGKGFMVNNEPLPIINHTFTITTILDESHKSPLNYSAFAMISLADVREAAKSPAFFGNYTTFLKLNTHSSPEKLHEKLDVDTTKRFNDIKLVKFSDVYLDESGQSRQHENLINRRETSLLKIGLVVAFAVLLIASFNYINITMTRARGRLKNIAGQRIFGASKWAVRWQTVLDTTLLVLLSFGLSLLFVNALAPQFNGFLDSQISIADLTTSINAVTVATLLLLLIILPSLYILLKIEVSSPMETFKNPLGHNVKISSAMVVVQFVISVVLITVSLNISRQMEFLSTQRPMADVIIRIAYKDYTDGNGLGDEFIDKVKSQAWVESHTKAAGLSSGSMSSDGVSMNSMIADNQALGFYKMKLIDGRIFEESEPGTNVIVNEALLRAFKIEQPAAGKTFKFGHERKIVGVVEDFMYKDAHTTIQPLFIQNLTIGRTFQLSIRVNGNVEARMEELKTMWKETHPDKIAIETQTLAQIYKEMHPQEQRLMTMVNIFMAISMALTALGLFGLAFYTVGRRTREIAIRKIHGSTTARVILMLCRTFAIWVGIAFVVAVPIAYYLSNEWLSTFIYRVPIVAWVFIATAGVAALITFVTVIFQTWSAARANPARSIKAE